MRVIDREEKKSTERERMRRRYDSENEVTNDKKICDLQYMSED
jgi:hypothetical protein